jgi:pimeloyl-ACP methyl ester carboxylesterase
MFETNEITLRDGRTLAVHRAPGRADRTVVLCHPAPGAGGFDPDPAQTAAREVTLLAPDRAGYGGSTPLPGDAWSDVDVHAADLVELLDTLAPAGPVGLAGWGAGGRVALAAAALRPDAVDRVVVFGAAAPDDAVPWHPDELRAALATLPGGVGPDAAAAALAPVLLPPVTGAGPLAFLGGTEPDDDLLDSVAGARDRLAAMGAAAFAQGTTGYVAEVAGYTLRPWGFEPGEVKAKTLLTYGSRDRVAANRHATWWQRNLPQARVEMAPGRGRLTVLGLWKRALSHLTPKR